ncbi:nitroreductase family protein, partial [Nanoarchaeota archaeon]
MNNIINTIRTRRSIRAYHDKPVPKETIKQLIDCARHAPSAMNAQPWNFIVIQKKKLIKELSERVKHNGSKYLKLWPLTGFISRAFWKKTFRHHIRPFMISKHDTIFYNAPCIILITAKPTLNSNLDCSCAAENLMLAAHSLKLGTCWIGFARFLDKDRKTYKKLTIPKGHKTIATIILG